MTAASAADPKTSSSSAVTTHRGEVARRTSARRASLGSRTATISWPSPRRFLRWRCPMEPTPITTMRIARASRLHVRSRGAPHRSLPLLRVASVRVTEFVLSAQLVHGRPGELDDLLVGQVAEIRAHLLALLQHVRPALEPGAQDIVGDDVGAARAAPHHVESGAPPAFAQLGEKLERPAVVRHEEVVEEMDVDDAVAGPQELHLVDDLARTPEPIRLAEVRRVAVIARLRGVGTATRGDHGDRVLTGRHRRTVDPLRLPVEMAHGVHLVDLVFGPP